MEQESLNGRPPRSGRTEAPGAQLLALISGLSRGCFHRRVGWPQRNRQRCLSCGGWRPYDVNRGVRGEWNPPERLQAESSSVLATRQSRTAGRHAPAAQQLQLVSTE